MIKDEIQKNIEVKDDDVNNIPTSNELNTIPLRRKKRDISRQGPGNCGNGMGGGSNSGMGNNCGKKILYYL